MSTVNKIDWYSAAWLRWPQATISGDGPYVSLVNCFPNKAARLFATFNEARAENEKPCGDVRCHVSNHWVVKLLPMKDHGSRERD